MSVEIEDKKEVANESKAIKFVVFSSYGNDSIALIQWCHEQDLDGVAVVFTDTKWAADGWMKRVEDAEVEEDLLGIRGSCGTFGECGV